MKKPRKQTRYPRYVTRSATSKDTSPDTKASEPTNDLTKQQRTALPSVRRRWYVECFLLTAHSHRRVVEIRIDLYVVLDHYSMTILACQVRLTRNVMSIH